MNDRDVLDRSDFYAGDDIEPILAKAKAAGYAAVRFNEGKGESDSIYVFNLRKLMREGTLLTFPALLSLIREAAPPGWDRRVEKLKPKMQKQYGKKAGERVAFAVAWKQYKKEHQK